MVNPKLPTEDEIDAAVGQVQMETVFPHVTIPDHPPITEATNEEEPAPDLYVGTRVQIHSLQAKPALNDCVATCHSYVAETDRWAVTLDTASRAGLVASFALGSVAAMALLPLPLH